MLDFFNSQGGDDDIGKPNHDKLFSPVTLHIRLDIIDPVPDVQIYVVGDGQDDPVKRDISDE